MGQCVASCGSERQVDSVPQTPDSEILPSLVATSPSLAIAALTRKYNHPDRVYPFGGSPVGSEASTLKLRTHLLPSSDSVMNDSLRRFNSNSPKHRNKNFSNKSVSFFEPEGNRKIRKPLISFNRAQIRTPSSKKQSLKKSSLQQSSYLLSSKLISNDNIISTIQQKTNNSETTIVENPKKEESSPSTANGCENLDNRGSISKFDTMGNNPSSYEGRKCVLTDKTVINTNNSIHLNNDNESTQGQVDNVELDQNGNCKESIKNLNAIREETKLLREKFFSPEPPKQLSNTLAHIMNRPNRFGYNRPPQTIPNKPTDLNTSGFPKLYSVPNHQTTSLNPGPNSSPKGVRKLSDNSNQKLGNAPASKFRINPALARLTPLHSSAATSKSNDPDGKPSSANNFDDKNPVEICRGKKSTPPCQRRAFTFGSNTALRATRNETESVKRTINAPVGTCTTTFSGLNYSKYSSGRYGVKKPEETKPFYTIGLYNNRPSAQETKSNFAVHSSGFQNVSTGLVKEKTLQYQTKVGLPSKKIAPSSAPTQTATTKLIPPLIRSTTWTKTEEEQLKIDTEPTKPDCSHSNVPNSKNPVKEDIDMGRFPLPLERNHSSDSFSGSSRPISISSREDHENERRTTTTETESSEETEIHDGRFPIRHDTSGASSLAASGHADNVISDSEFLIDDEISDQPELTLTFKDSSVILSPSSSGESLVSCDIMLDLKERNFADLTSDSAISDVSSHKPSSVERIDWSSEHKNNNNNITTKIKSVDEGGGQKTNMKLPCSQIPLSTPLSSKPNKASFRASRIHQSQNTTQIQKLTRSINNPVPPEGRNLQKPVSSTYKPVSNIPSIATRNKASTEKRPTFMKQNQNRPTSISSTITTNSIPQTRQLKPERPMGITASKEVADIGKSALIKKVLEPEDLETSNPVSVEDLEDLKSSLVELQLILKENEQREKEKDELISQLKEEIALLKGSGNPDKNIGRIVKSPKTKREFKYSGNENKMANAAVQTENNNIINKAVTYPDENDKLGQLVSFRIGRFSTSTKKS